ncbi:MAG: hypothetical protein MUP90_16195 [Gammaproteobacteria bacterium]|nr:hypothetical protein [Gammaproteobacteria bacterium]
MFKKSTFLVLGLVGLTLVGVFAYRLVSPEIVVVNESATVLNEVVVQLPYSRVVFGPIPADSESAIYYSASQIGGTYRYTVEFAGGRQVSGSCGTVKQDEYGKQLKILVTRSGSVECHEHNTLF